MIKSIPIHDFVSDSKDSVFFKYISLGALSNYDFSLPHRHNYYEIFFFTKGGGSHLIDFLPYPIQDGSIHFVSPGQVHTVKRALDTYGSIVLFSRDFFHSIPGIQQTLFNFPFLNNSQFPILPVSAADYAEFGPILNQVQNEIEKDQEKATAILHSYLNIILLKCLQLFDVHYPAYQAKSSSLFNDFRALLENDYRTQRQPASYASKLNISEKKLNLLCKEHNGVSVSEYIKGRILLEAKRILSNTDHSIKEIASFLHFEDPSYFNRFFKSNTGMTAGEFRKSK